MNSLHQMNAKTNATTMLNASTVNAFVRAATLVMGSTVAVSKLNVAIKQGKRLSVYKPMALGSGMVGTE